LLQLGPTLGISLQPIALLLSNSLIFNLCFFFLAHTSPTYPDETQLNLVYLVQLKPYKPSFYLRRKSKSLPNFLPILSPWDRTPFGHPKAVDGAELPDSVDPHAAEACREAEVAGKHLNSRIYTPKIFVAEGTNNSRKCN